MKSVSVDMLKPGLILARTVINDDMVEAMIIAGKKANACNTPVVFDPVGAGVAAYRNSVAERIIKSKEYS